MQSLTSETTHSPTGATLAAELIPANRDGTIYHLAKSNE